LATSKTGGSIEESHYSYVASFGSKLQFYQPSEVLTKPDRIPIGEQGSWLDIFSKEQKNSQHGCYCVKQPDQQQLSDGIFTEEARENEHDFFATTEPWTSLPQDLKAMVGTDCLTRALGGKLFDLICKRYDLDLVPRVVCPSLTMICLDYLAY
jgi:hypothetical protein